MGPYVHPLIIPQPPPTTIISESAISSAGSASLADPDSANPTPAKSQSNVPRAISCSS